MRWFAFVGAVLVVLLLSGCTGSGVVTLSDGHVTNATGSRTSSGSCDGSALVSFSASGQAGSVRARVHDADDRVVFDSGATSGDSASSSLEVEGAKGTWTIEVVRTFYTGSYSVSLVC